jgi:hypothetical protein
MRSLRFWKSLLPALMITGMIGLLLSESVLAQRTPPQRTYTPQGGSPPDVGPPSGSRGNCEGLAADPFTALAPASQIGKTTATHPTVLLYVPDGQPRLINFRIYSYEATEGQRRLVYDTQLDSSPGLMRVTLPQSHSGLSLGERYYWQAALICNPNRGSQDLIVGASLEVVDGSTPETERWYDLTETADNAELTSLLGDLISAERASGHAVGQRQSEDLSRVVGILP